MDEVKSRVDRLRDISRFINGKEDADGEWGRDIWLSTRDAKAWDMIVNDISWKIKNTKSNLKTCVDAGKIEAYEEVLMLIASAREGYK